MLRSFVSRHRWFRRTLSARAQTEPQREQKSRLAEEAVASALAHHAATKAPVIGVRVPDPSRFLGSGEVDVMVVTERAVLLVEVKNYAGPIKMVNDDVCQAKLLDKGEASSILPKLNQKVANFQRMGVTMLQNPGVEAIGLVVLANEAAQPDETCLNHPQVATMATLDEKIEALLRPYPSLDSDELGGYHAMIREFGTWDCLSTQAGLIVNGDLMDASLPPGWDRRSVESIQVRPVGGWWVTLLRGPRIEVTVQGLDGESSTEVMKPGLTVTHSQPWNGKTTYPIEHFTTIRFGHRCPLHEDNKGRRVQSFPVLSDHIKKRDSGQTIPVMNPVDKITPASLFPPGTKTSGKIVKHLRDAGGHLTGILVSLVERELNGLLNRHEVSKIEGQFFDFFYKVGSTIEVEVVLNEGPGKIRLALC